MRQSTLGSRCKKTGDMSFEFDVFHEFPRCAGQIDAEAFAQSFAQVDASEEPGARVSCGQGSKGAATPPSSVMNSRRLTRSPRRRTPTQRVHHAADFQFVSSHDAEIRIHRHSGRRML